MLLGEHAGQVRAFFSQDIIEVGSIRASDDLLVILILFDDDYHVVVPRKVWWPSGSGLRGAGLSLGGVSDFRRAEMRCV